MGLIYTCPLFQGISGSTLSSTPSIFHFSIQETERVDKLRL